MERIKIKRNGIFTATVALSLCATFAWGCSGDTQTTVETTQENATTTDAASAEAVIPETETTVSGESTTAAENITATQKDETTETTVSEADQAIEDKLTSMTIEEKVAQMFAVMPETVSDASPVTSGYELKEGLYEYPLGGILFMKQNIVSSEQTKEMINNVQAYSEDRIGLPLFVFVDEEGGTVRRVSGNLEGIPYLKGAEEMYADGDDIYQTGKMVGAYLSDLGFNVDFAPVADVVSDLSADVINGRSFSSDPEAVAKAVTDFAAGLESEGVYGTFKHFPGHGPTTTDTHKGSAYVGKTLKELEEWDLIPFQRAVDNGAKFIMISHHCVNATDPDGTPATLSKAVITDLLRDKMGYKGIVVSDALNMGAIADYYTPAEAALMAVNAGADILLEPKDFYSAYDAVLAAVQNGDISEDRIDESVRRILGVKIGDKKQ